MGVRTVKFGPPTWRFLEGVAAAFDVRILKCKDQSERDVLICLMKSFLSTFGFIIPCVYCRISFQSFTTDNDCDNINLDQNLIVEHGAKRLIYNIHNCVNEKLKTQCLIDAATSSERNKVCKQCDINSITFEEALESRFVLPSDIYFWDQSVLTLLYIMCDESNFDGEYVYITDFLDVYSKLMVHLNFSFMQTFMDRCVRSIQSKELTTLEQRLEIVKCYKKMVYTYWGKEFTWNKDKMLQLCYDAIVGCDKSI